MNTLTWLQSLGIRLNANPSYSGSKTISSIEQITEFAASHPVLSHAFFEHLPVASPPEVTAWLRHREVISRCFSPFLSYVIGGILEEDLRKILVHNLQEEHGLGDVAHPDPHPLMWKETFAHFNLLQNGEIPDLEKRDLNLYPATKDYIEWHLNVCMFAPEAGLGAIALTESLLHRENRRIVEIMKGWEAPESAIRFFQVHIECDEGHSNQILEVARQIASKSTSAESLILSGVTTAAFLRERFYDGLLTSAQSQIRLTA